MSKHIPPLTQDEFELLYRSELARNGTGVTDADVASSWAAYQRNPQGHWLHGATR